jgi:hypothetical protein
MVGLDRDAALARPATLVLARVEHHHAIVVRLVE